MLQLCRRKRGCVRAAARAVAVLAALLAAAPAMAAGGDRWVADEAEARASLPLPPGDSGVTGAALSCAAQRWRLEIMLSAPVAQGKGEAELRVDGNGFAALAAAADTMLAIKVPQAAIAPLKRGLRLEIGLPEALADAAGELGFSLRGSNVALGMVEERCTLRDMAAYQPVAFATPSIYDAIVRTLRADDIEAFADATASQPQVSAAIALFEEGRRVLFTRLCGSSWYFGRSGCNITGYVRDEGSKTGWRAVYDTEDVAIHVDERARSEGWPDLVTLPVRTGGAALLWRWDGRAYQLMGELPEEEENGDAPEPLVLRPGHD